MDSIKKTVLIDDYIKLLESVPLDNYEDMFGFIERDQYNPNKYYVSIRAINGQNYEVYNYKMTSQSFTEDLFDKISVNFFELNRCNTIISINAGNSAILRTLGPSSYYGDYYKTLSESFISKIRCAGLDFNSVYCFALKEDDISMYKFDGNDAYAYVQFYYIVNDKIPSAFRGKDKYVDVDMIRGDNVIQACLLYYNNGKYICICYDMTNDKVIFDDFYISYPKNDIGIKMYYHTSSKMIVTMEDSFYIIEIEKRDSKYFCFYPQGQASYVSHVIYDNNFYLILTINDEYQFRKYTYYTDEIYFKIDDADKMYN